MHINSFGAWALGLSLLMLAVGLHGCGALDDDSNETPVMSIAMTAERTPFLDYTGPGTMDENAGEQLQPKAFHVTLDTRMGGTFATIQGEITRGEYARSIVTINVDTQREMHLQVNGMTRREVQPASYDSEPIVLAPGEHTLTVEGVFETYYEWQ